MLVDVGGHPIRIEDFRREYVDYLASTGLPDEPRRRTSFLERMISMRLVALEARADGLAEGEAHRLEEERARRRLLVDAWLEEAAYDTITVGEPELEALFLRVNTRVTARHLYAPTEAGARELAGRLAAGETFEDLAREVFADPELAARGGSVGSFGFDEMDPAFEEAAFRLPVGAVSGPVRTAQGWSVIRVDDRFVQPLITESEFAARRPQMAAYIVERERNDARRRLMDRVLEEAAPRLDGETVDRLLAVLGPGLAEGEAAGVDPGSVLVRFRRGEGESSWTVERFLEAARYTDEAQRRAVRDRRSLDAFVSGLVVRELLMERSRDLGLDRTERFRGALSRAMDTWLYEQGYERIAASEPIADDTLRAWYARYADDYVLPERVAVREIVVTTAATADSLRNALEQADFAELARRHSVRTASSASGGDLGYLTRDELGPLADRVFDAPPGAVIGPVPVRGVHLLLEVGDRQPARPATFEEVRSDLEAEIRREHRARLVRERTDLLRGRYDIRYAEVDLAALPLREEPVVSS